MTDPNELDQDAASDGFADHRSRLRAHHFRSDQEDAMSWCPKCSGLTYAGQDCIHCGHYVPSNEAEEGRWSDLRCIRYVRAWEEQRRKGLL